VTAAIILGAAFLSAAAPRFAASEIEPEADLEGHWTADVDGDGRADLLLGVWSRTGGRELLVHLQAPDGRFPTAPDRRVGIKADVTAFAVADVREEPGAELLLFTPSGCFGFSASKGGYAGNARRLFDCAPICAVPSPKRIFALEAPADLDGDGSPDLLVPEAGDWSIYGRGPDGSFARKAVFPLPLSETRPKKKDRRLELRLGPGASFGREGEDAPPFAERWEDGGRRRAGPLLALDRWIPRPILADLDGDGRKDFLYLDREAGDLKIHRQAKDGSFPVRPEMLGRIGEVGSLTARDLDGDGRADLLACDGASDDEGKIRFFLDRDREGVRRFHLDEPDGLLKVSGYGVRALAADLDGDGKAELAVLAYNLSAADLVQGGKVVRTLLVYRRDPDNVFGRRPVSRLDETMVAADWKALGQPVNLEADILGTGGRQAISLDARGAVICRRFGPDLRLEPEPCWRFVPRKAVVGIGVLALDGDARSDLVLRHMRSLTVLVSR
jgi:hypothetical protein